MIVTLAWMSSSSNVPDRPHRQDVITIELARADRQPEHGKFRLSDVSDDSRPRGVACEFPRQCLKKKTLAFEPLSVSASRQAVAELLPIAAEALPEPEIDKPVPDQLELARRDLSDPPDATSSAVNSPDNVRRSQRPSNPLAKIVVAAQPHPPGVTAASGVDRLPRKLHENPGPLYPPDAIALRQEGSVLLEVLVDQRGLVAKVSVSKSSGFASLDKAALDTVRAWRFEPARRDGKPVSTVVALPIRFSLSGQ